MSYHIEFTDEALEDIERLKKTGNRKLLTKLASFYAELQEHPRTGTGHVERLKYYKEETWSIRLSEEHRLVYRVIDDLIQVLVISAFGHYIH